MVRFMLLRHGYYGRVHGMSITYVMLGPDVGAHVRFMMLGNGRYRDVCISRIQQSFALMETEFTSATAQR